MREATRADLPKGNEAQCPLCWRLFASDATCEKHKRYPRRGQPSCVDPTGSLLRRDRRGLAVWVQEVRRFAAEARTGVDHEAA